MTDQNALISRTGAPPRLIAGPSRGQQSLYQQQVLDEDTYTDALSHIITRDFFPNLPHIHATNNYLTALTNNDPELLSHSIRQLAQLAQEKEDGKAGGTERGKDVESRRRELENVGTPYISIPGGRAPMRTPLGARGWDTPLMKNGEGSTRRRPAEAEDLDELEGSAVSSRVGKKRKVVEQRRVRDDLSLDAFQRNYTSEDNASFVQIVDEENRRRQEDRWSWAWEAEKKAEMRRIEGEEKRRLLLEAATSGGWKVDGNGRRLIGGLGEGGREKDAEAWKEVKLIGAIPSGSALATETEGEGVVVPYASTSTALVKQSETLRLPTIEAEIPHGHPLRQALTDAGLPATALISEEDGSVVPYREVTSGGGEGRGRGAEDRAVRQRIERDTMGDGPPETVSLGGSGADGWKYKTMNNLMFPADANTKPYPQSRSSAISAAEAARQAPREIKHANTRLPDEEEAGFSGSRVGSTKGSSPARSWVEAAVSGTPYRPGGSMPVVDNYPLLPADPSPSPTDLPSLLTWGTLLATPRALDGSSDPLDVSGPIFQMPEAKRRDELGRRLGDKAARSMNHRAKGFTPSSLRAAVDRTQLSVRGSKTPGEMLPPASTPRRSDALTPAGKRLLERSLGKTPVSASRSSGLAGASGRNRSAVMDKISGWGGGKGDLGGRNVGGMSWTPSPRKH